MGIGYFDNYGTVLYANLDNPNAIAQGDFQSIVNIWQRCGMLSTVLNNIALYYTYSIQDTDRPDIIAEKLYGDATLYWIIMFSNQILDPYWGWPQTTNELNASITSAYGSIANAYQTLDHYEKHTNVTSTAGYQTITNTYVSIIATDVTEIDGSSELPTLTNPIIQVGANNLVSFGNGVTVDTSVQLTANDAYSTAFNSNETLRNILIPHPQYSSQIAQELQNLLSQ